MVAIDPNVAAAFAAGRVPADPELAYVTPEYLSETRDTPASIAVIFVCAFTSLIVLLRCFSRIFLVKRFGIDDALAVFSTILYVAFVVLSIILIDQGSGRHIEYIQYVLTPAQVDLTEVNDFAAHLIYTSALFVCRMSGLYFYFRICDLHDKLVFVIKCAAVFLVCVYLPQIFLIIFHCLPVTGLWPYEWQSSINDYKCITWGIVYSVNSSLSLVCDFVLFTIPVFIIKNLHINRKRKVQLSLVLLPGLLVIVISIVRLYLVIAGQWAADGSWAYNPFLAIESSEISGTLIALSVPALKPLFGSWFRQLNGTLRATSDAGSAKHTATARSDGPPSMGPGPGGSKPRPSLGGAWPPHAPDRRAEEGLPRGYGAPAPDPRARGRHRSDSDLLAEPDVVSDSDGTSGETEASGLVRGPARVRIELAPIPGGRTS